MQGPTIMWNMKYGVTSTGMMGYLTSTSSGGMMGGNGMMTWLRGTLQQTWHQAWNKQKTLAQQYLDANNTGTIVGQVTTYYGYYTMQVLKDSNVVGMMSVYGNTGQVRTTHGWEHSCNRKSLAKPQSYYLFYVRKAFQKTVSLLFQRNYLTIRSL